MMASGLEFNDFMGLIIERAMYYKPLRPLGRVFGSAQRCVDFNVATFERRKADYKVTQASDNHDVVAKGLSMGADHDRVLLTANAILLGGSDTSTSFSNSRTLVQNSCFICSLDDVELSMLVKRSGRKTSKKDERGIS